jgi:hypothetical protein
VSSLEGVFVMVVSGIGVLYTLGVMVAISICVALMV